MPDATETKDKLVETHTYMGHKIEIIIEPPFTRIDIDGWPVFITQHMSAKYEKGDICLYDETGRYAGMLFPKG